MRQWIRASLGSAATAMLVLSSTGSTLADGESYEELLRQRQALDARIRAMESGGAGLRLRPIQDDPHEHPADDDHARDDHAHGDEHAHGNEHGEHGEAAGHNHAGEEWRWEDPYYPGWWRPSDEYRPHSWSEPPHEGFLTDLFRGQFVETHRSSSGTPWVHPFTIEPPQLHRDVLVAYKYTKDAEGTEVDEHESEVHFDWALTRRFGILVAAPFIGLIGPDEQAAGFGDVEIAPRIVLVESERFFLSSNILVTAPTGDETRDLGAGETVISPMLTSWHDLGNWAPWTNWNTAYFNVGPESGVSSGETTLVYTAVFAHSFMGPKLIFPHQHGGNGHSNGHAGHGSNGHGNGGHEHFVGTISPIGPGYPPGLTSIIVEFNGQSELFDERESYFQILTGINYILTDSAEFRFGVNLPLNAYDAQMDAQYIFGMSFIF